MSEGVVVVQYPALCNLYVTWKSLRVQGFMIDPDSIGIVKKIKLDCHDGNLGELFLFA